jgi:Phosphotransferase enzyme family
LAGDHLCHADIRADNLLLRADGQVVVVDWPWACPGAPWYDRLLLLLNVALYGGDATRPLRQLADDTNTDINDVVGPVAGFAGFFTDRSRQPPPPGLPSVRRSRPPTSDPSRPGYEDC